MTRHLGLLVALPATVILLGAHVAAAEWIFRPSTYSHDPATAQRVNQFAAEQPAFARVDPTYLESGYRHIRSAIRGPDGSYDYGHIVQTWGEGEWIRPYGEWLFPYRAGATPYGPWGNPQGPWTLPFESWVNPYGAWNRWPYNPQPWWDWGFGPAAPGPTGPPGGYAPGAYPPGGASPAPYQAPAPGGAAAQP